jgi:Tfp pilus assembly protein PilF
VLEHAAYDGSANFIYGNLLLRQSKLVEAEEALSIAARTMEYRSASYVYIAGIRLQKIDLEQAVYYAKQSLEYNQNNLLAYQYLATAYRKLKNNTSADSVLQVLLKVDPLNHYARFEQYLLHPAATSLSNFTSAIRNELPHETYLELALTYANAGLNDEAIKVLEQAPPYPTVYYWLAFLKRNTAAGESQAFLKKAAALSPAFVFPYRLETIPVLTWAQQQLPSWKTTYYLGLVYWNNLRTDKAKELFEQCGDKPDFAPFYLARGAAFDGDKLKSDFIGQNYAKAVQMAPDEWRTWNYQTNHLFDNSQFEKSYTGAKEAYKRFTQNPVVSISYAKALLNTDRLNESINVLNKTLVLPQEGAQEGHEIYEAANLSLALKMIEQKKYQAALKYLSDARKWPENLGSGSPYDPDNRLQDFIAAYCQKKLGNQKEAESYDQKISDYSLSFDNWSSGRNALNNYISVLVLNQKGKQQELKKLVTEWKNEQDSIRNWSITQNAGGRNYQWVLAKYNNDSESAKLIEKELAAPVMVNRYKILRKALEVCK